jgi:pyruvate dehydrogenase E1 component alpha subunit
MPGVPVDGTDVFAVYDAVGEAIARARRGDGPSLIEARAFRYYGHFQGDAITYRTEANLAEYRRRDPLTTFRKHTLERGLLSPEDFDVIDARSGEMVEQAVRQAEAAPYPVPAELLTDVYVHYV